MSIEEIKAFVKKMIRQSEEDLAAEQERGEETENWSETIMGQLNAYKLVLGFIEKIEEKNKKLH